MIEPEYVAKIYWPTAWDEEKRLSWIRVRFPNFYHVSNRIMRLWRHSPGPFRLQVFPKHWDRRTCAIAVWQTWHKPGHDAPWTWDGFTAWTEEEQKAAAEINKRIQELRDRIIYFKRHARTPVHWCQECRQWHVAAVDFE